jgi:hypothetical protein
MRTAVGMLLVVGVVALLIGLAVGCSGGEEPMAPYEDVGTDMTLDDDGGYMPPPRTGQWSSIEQDEIYWIGGFGDYTTIGLANTQANINIGGTTRDYAIIAGFNKEITAYDYKAYFMLYWANSNGHLTNQWTSPKYVSGRQSDYIRDIAWDEEHGSRFYFTDEEPLEHPTISRVCCHRYYYYYDNLYWQGWWGSKGSSLSPNPTTGEPYFDYPLGISIAYRSNEPVLFVCDSHNKRVVVMYGYHSTSSKRGDQLSYFIENYNWEPIGISVQYIGEEVIQVPRPPWEITYDIYHAVVTYNTGEGTGKICIYRITCDREYEDSWYWDRRKLIGKNPTNSSWNLEHNIQQVETITFEDRIYFIVCHPSFCDSQVFEWYYEYNDSGYITSGPNFELVGTTVVNCSGAEYQGAHDPYFGVCGDLYGYYSRIYTTGRHRYIIDWL